MTNLNRKYVWEKWTDYFYEDCWKPVLKETPKIYQKLVVLALTIGRWYTPLWAMDMTDECPICYLYDDTCSDCFLPETKAGNCWNLDSYYHQFDLDPSVKKIRKIRRLLINLYKEEYRKVFGV